MDNKKTVNLLAISGIVLIFIAFLFEPSCIFKKIFHIPCISCGLTRAFKLILQLKLWNALKLNILSIFLFISAIIFYFAFILSFIFKKNYVYNLYDWFIKRFYFFIIIMISGWIINLIIFYLF